MLKIKRKFSIVLAVLLIVSIFAGCSSKAADTKSITDGAATTQAVSDEAEETAESGNSGNDKDKNKDKDESEPKDNQSEEKTDKSGESNPSSADAKENKGNKEQTSSKSSSKSKTTQNKKAETTKANTTKKAQSTVSTCTLTIECTAVLDNMSSLKAGHEKYVPGDGYILKNKKMTLSKGDTVYDMLKDACSDSGIRLTASNSTFGIYVTGINNIDEKDCGRNSGWTYWVNGNMPMVTCGKYTVSNGDAIKFSYVV